MAQTKEAVVKERQRRKDGVVYQSKRFLWIVVFCTTICIRQIGKKSPSFPNSNSVTSTVLSSYAFSRDDLDIFKQNDCFVMSDICTSLSDNDAPYWFYKRPEQGNHDDDNDDNHNEQPDFVLEWSPHSQQVILNKSTTHPDKSAQQKCKASPVPNHIVVTGQFVDMVMEVYVRIVAGLWELWHQFPDDHWWKITPNNPHVQLYVQVRGESGKTDLIPTMHSLFKGFSSNPIRNFLNLLDDSSTAAEEQQGSSSCQCYERLIFCGYFDENARGRFYQRRNKKRAKRKQPQNRSSVQQPVVSGSTWLHLKPGLQVGRRKGENVDPPIRWDLIRNHTRNGAFLSYLNMQQRVLDFKRDLLVQALRTAVPNATKTWIQQQVSAEQLKGWTLVGFSQRNVRRRWVNLGDILEYCLQEWLLNYKMICVEIELDSALGRVPENQVIMHAGLDALIGVHGSQQVHAVWMPDGAFVLELLPHLLGQWGQWTQSTESRTPNGKMINHTALNHVGYPLDASSIPDCKGAPQSMERCNNETRWDNRDIWVQLSIIDAFVHKFLVLPSRMAISLPYHPTVTNSPLRPCHYFDEVSFQEFVLYHVNCWEHNGDRHLHKHYFRPRNSFLNLHEDVQR